MALSPFYKSAEDVPDEVKSIYIEKEGLFVLDVEQKEGYSLENVTGLKSALQSERNNSKTLNEKLVGFQALNETLNQQASIKKPTEGDLGKVSQLEMKISEMTTVMKERDSLYNGLKLKNEVNSAFSAYQKDLMPNADKLLLPHIESKIKMIDGAVKVVDHSGQVRISTNGSSVTDMTVNELIGEFKNDSAYSTCWKGTNASGSGATSSGSSLTSGKSFKEMSLVEKTALYNDNPALYESMKKGN